MFNLNDEVALVTGGAQGIGLGIARELARAGARVVIADRDLERARAAAAELSAAGDTAIALALDVTQEETVGRCVENAIERFSRVTVLVNNAGIHCEKLGQLSTVEHFQRCFDVNVFGIWRVTLALLPHFKAQGGGKIVNIASINGRKPWVETPAYSASKAAVINLTQSMASNLGADNINVNAVCPGGVMTAMADFFKEDRPGPEMLNRILSQRVLKRVLQPEDIGRAVVFFASSYAHNITGQSLNVDGGTVMS